MGRKIVILGAGCVMGTGLTNLLLVGEHALEPRGLAAVVPGPQAHGAKLAYENPLRDRPQTRAALSARWRRD